MSNIQTSQSIDDCLLCALICAPKGHGGAALMLPWSLPVVHQNLLTLPTAKVVRRAASEQAGHGSPVCGVVR